LAEDLITVQGVRNSWDVMETKHDFSSSRSFSFTRPFRTYSSASFLSVISLKEPIPLGFAPRIAQQFYFHAITDKSYLDTKNDIRQCDDLTRPS
jgi:hypothetical protein